MPSCSESPRELREAGYTAVKTGPMPYSHYEAISPEVRQTAKLMEALRDAAGDEMDILVDFHGRPGSPRAALAYHRGLRAGRPMFVEEPIQPGDTSPWRRSPSRRDADRHRRAADHPSRV